MHRLELLLKLQNYILATMWQFMCIECLAIQSINPFMPNISYVNFTEKKQVFFFAFLMRDCNLIMIDQDNKIIKNIFTYFNHYFANMYINQYACKSYGFSYLRGE